MEIKVFHNVQAWHANKPKFVAAVQCYDLFDYKASINVFKSIYGNECVIIFSVL